MKDLTKGQGKIMQIRPYITFKGECQEAIELYKRAFKIEEPEIMRFSDMPQKSRKPTNSS